MQGYKMTNSKNSTSLLEKFSSAMHKLKVDAKNEWEKLCKISCKELKTLFVISTYTFILIFHQIQSNKWNFQEELENVMENIFSKNTLISIITTVVAITIVRGFFVKSKMKFVECIRDKLKLKLSERYYLVSTTLLDRIAAIALAALGLSIPLLIFLQIFYPQLDDGKFSNEISRIKLFLLFFVVSSWFFGVNIIFKYFSEEIKSAREENRKINDPAPAVFVILYAIFIILPIPLLKFIYNN